jgi:hypothetical protein
MYESRDANPFYQSEDLDHDAARAEWERQGEPPGEPERADDTLQAAREAYQYAVEKADELYRYDGDDPLVRSYYARQHTAWLKDAASEIAYAHRLTLRQVTGGGGQ